MKLIETKRHEDVIEKIYEGTTDETQELFYKIMYELNFVCRPFVKFENRCTVLKVKSFFEKDNRMIDKMASEIRA